MRQRREVSPVHVEPRLCPHAHIYDVETYSFPFPIAVGPYHKILAAARLLLQISYDIFLIFFCELVDLYAIQVLKRCVVPVFAGFRVLDFHHVAEDRRHPVCGLLIIDEVSELKNWVVLRTSLELQIDIKSIKGLLY